MTSIALCPVATISAESSRGFDPTSSGADTVFVVHHGGRLGVFLNRCPHQGVPLEYRKDAFLSTDGEHIMCYAHGARFEVESGRCIHGPCLGQHLQRLCITLLKVGFGSMTSPRWFLPEQGTE